ncbi:M20/M25/M40 family metallo-hydrolase [Thermococcus sp. M39]|uniref:M20/M25/M40 family metallo-hydrolase n=1 Tax=unclassified Thermococcus TaxID=2627626 RepID=UPI00143B56D3|nr:MULTISPECIES: M20/M25/M40 family metallo-hydrolase [unclassified Thermococcus]NJE08759.1 M20/M25/M40 family metallo-hydrolase [Thermococcus sp. M39]NJE12939.1 M20/M25/M40 family metallo-hydrolase [Thermococcus sp. LS2]
MKAERAKEILINLLKIPSPSGKEDRLALHIMEFLHKLGYDVHIESDGEIINLIVNPDAELFYEVHMDTIDIRVQPFIRGNIVYGTGASDVKGGLASILLMLESLKKEGKDLNVGIVFVSDEEKGGRGSALFMERYRPKMAIVLEPTDLEVHIAHAGNIEAYFEVDGKEAHGACPESGENAIELTYRMLEELKALEPFKQKGKYFDPHIGLQELVCENPYYLIPALCKGRLEARLLPEQEVEDILDLFEPILEEYTLRYEYTEIWDGYELDENEEIVQIAKKAMDLTGLDEFGGMRSWTDAINFMYNGTKTIVFGPGNLDISHTKNEHIDVRDVVKASEFLTVVNDIFGKS